MATMYERESRIDHIARTLKRKREKEDPSCTSVKTGTVDDKLDPFTIGKTGNHVVEILRLAQQHPGDPAVKVGMNLDVPSS